MNYKKYYVFFINISSILIKCIGICKKIIFFSEVELQEEIYYLISPIKDPEFP